MDERNLSVYSAEPGSLFNQLASCARVAHRYRGVYHARDLRAELLFPRALARQGAAQPNFELRGSNHHGVAGVWLHLAGAAAAKAADAEFAGRQLGGRSIYPA